MPHKMKISLVSIKEASVNRKSGYEEEILKYGSVEGDYVVLPWIDFCRIKKQYALEEDGKDKVENLKINPPPIKEMAKTAMLSISNWAANGAKLSDDQTIESRLNTCKSCEFWNSKGFGGSGRCMKCGCSTWFKLRMATEKCPIGKW